MESMLIMIKESSMIKASELKVGDKISCGNSKEYVVICNRSKLPVKRLILRDDESNQVVLFYDEDVEYAKDILNIDLTTNQ